MSTFCCRYRLIEITNGPALVEKIRYVFQKILILYVTRKRISKVSKQKVNIPVDIHKLSVIDYSFV